MKIFIGWDSEQAEIADVLAYSLQKYASTPLDIHFLKIDELEFDRPLDPLQSTEFTYTRFLPPHLCGYEGKALFMDCDMLCLGDINQLDQLDMSSYALRVVKHDHNPTSDVKMDGRRQTSYPRKNWSSLMLMNCSKLKLWSKEVVETESGAFLHRFQGIPDEQIGEIPDIWNTLDWMDDRTQLIHYTAGGPWFEEQRDHPYGKIWFQHLEEYRNSKREKTLVGATDASNLSTN